MGLFNEIAKIAENPVGYVEHNVADPVVNAVKDVGSWVDDNVLQPIKEDPVKFAIIATAYAYGVPGLEFAGPGTAAAAGVASTGYSLAEGKDFDQAVKDGLTTAAFTAVGNEVSSAIKGPTTVPDIGVSEGVTPSAPGRFGSSEVGANTSFQGNAPAVPDVASGAPVTQPNPLNPASLQPTGLELGNPPINPNPQTGGGYGDVSRLSSNTPSAPAPAPEVYNPTTKLEIQANNVPQSNAPTSNVPQPDAPTRIQIQPREVPVYDLSQPATPMPQGTPTASQVLDVASAAGGDALSLAAAHPYYTTGALLLADSALSKKKPDQPGGGSTVDTSGYQLSLPQLTANQSYVPYGDSIYTYGQGEGSGEHKFLTDMVYEPVEYAKGGPVKMFGGGFLDQAVKAASLAASAEPVSYPVFADKKGSGFLDDIAKTTNDAILKSGQTTPQGSERVYSSYEPQTVDYNFNPLTYGLTGGEHRFFADGGPVGMPDGDPVQPPNMQGPAVGPMMAPTQAPPQQPMGALGQVNSMTKQPSPIAPNLGRPPVPMQAPRLGAMQQVKPQQQNPAYRYFSYGQIPPTVGAPLQPVQQPPQNKAVGGLMMAQGGNVADGRTDNIPAMLSPGEYVMDAETVALLGNGNNDAGAKRLDHMREAVRKQKGGALSKGKISPDAQSPLAYLSRRMA